MAQDSMAQDMAQAEDKAKVQDTAQDIEWLNIRVNVRLLGRTRIEDCMFSWKPVSETKKTLHYTSRASMLGTSNRTTLPVVIDKLLAPRIVSADPRL